MALGRPNAFRSNAMAFVFPGWVRGEATSVWRFRLPSVRGCARLRFGDRFDGSVVFYIGIRVFFQ